MKALILYLPRAVFLSFFLCISFSCEKKRLKHQNHLGKNKEGVNFMLYYQSGGPKNKGEVLEDENRMILLRLPKKVGC